jgi:hypothetical protein
MPKLILSLRVSLAKRTGSPRMGSSAVNSTLSKKEYSFTLRSLSDQQFRITFTVEKIRGKSVELNAFGALAQLVERINGIDEVNGSTPLRSILECLKPSLIIVERWFKRFYFFSFCLLSRLFWLFRFLCKCLLIPF